MKRILILIISLFFLNSCGGSGATTTNCYLVADNDYYDTDNAIYATIVSYVRNKNKCSTLLLQTEYGGDLVFRNILSTLNYTGYFGISKNSNDRALPLTKMDKALINKGYTSPSIPSNNGYIELITFLEKSPDKSVKYITGGKLIFLKNFLEDEYNYNLFLLKVKEIYFGLGCDMSSTTSCKDFNLVMNNISKTASQYVYNKLHNKIPFIVGVVHYNNKRIFDFYKTTDDVFTIIYGNGTYKNYGDISYGDIDSILPATNLVTYNTEIGNITFNGNRFIFKQEKGIDKRLYITSDVSSLLYSIITNYKDK